MSFDRCVHLWNHLQNHDTGHFYHPKSSLGGRVLSPRRGLVSWVWEGNKGWAGRPLGLERREGGRTGGAGCDYSHSRTLWAGFTRDNTSLTLMFWLIQQLSQMFIFKQSDITTNSIFITNSIIVVNSCPNLSSQSGFGGSLHSVPLASATVSARCVGYRETSGGDKANPSLCSVSFRVAWAALPAPGLRAGARWDGGRTQPTPPSRAWRRENYQRLLSVWHVRQVASAWACDMREAWEVILTINRAESIKILNH